MLSRDQILEILRSNRDKIVEFGAVQIGIFGSFANQSSNSNSDIDILVKFNPDKVSFNNYMDLKLFLEDIFDRKVDLVIEDDVRAELKDQIMSSVIYAA